MAVISLSLISEIILIEKKINDPINSIIVMDTTHLIFSWFSLSVINRII